MADSHQVSIGDETRTIRRFNGFKAVRAGTIIARITKKVPEVLRELATFTAEYERTNAIRVTPEMAKLPRFSRPVRVEGEAEDGTVEVRMEPIFTEADFEGRDVIEIPRSPSRQEELAAVFPLVYEDAQEELTELLALVVISNTDLKEADQEDAVDAKLKEVGSDLLHEAELGQLLELLAVAGEVLQEQFQGKTDRLQAVLNRFFQAPGTPQEREREEEPAKETPASSSQGSSSQEAKAPSTSPAPPEPSEPSSPTSSTDSERPTDGAETRSSSESPGSSSPSSVTV